MIKWRPHPKGAGVIVACDETLEWLLPWWWARYKAHNDFPVAFVDLGMSHFGRQFCQERGEVIPLVMESTLTGRPQNAPIWEELFGKEVWKCRKSWYKKPFSFLQTPFEETLWLDLDCEVLQNLSSLFELKSLTLAKEPDSSHVKERELGMLQEGEILYNSGVVFYTHKCPFIEKWALATFVAKEEFCSDQHILSQILFEEKASPTLLDPIFNWRITQGLNVNAAIIHWVGAWGKEYIRLHGGLAENALFNSIRGFPRDCSEEIFGNFEQKA